MSEVYIVEDQGNSPGKVYGVFAKKEHAEILTRQINNKWETIASTVPHKLHLQPVVLVDED